MTRLIMFILPQTPSIAQDALCSALLEFNHAELYARHSSAWFEFRSSYSQGIFNPR